MKNFYLFSCIAGFFLPYAFFLGWLQENGFNVSLFFATVTGENLSLFAWFDVLITALVLLVFIVIEGRRQQLPRLWLPIAGTCVVGPSFGLPLFLYQRHCHLEGYGQLQD